MSASPTNGVPPTSSSSDAAASSSSSASNPKRGSVFARIANSISPAATPTPRIDPYDEAEAESITASHEELRLSAIITSAQVVKDSGGEYVQYSITVQTGGASSAQTMASASSGVLSASNSFNSNSASPSPAFQYTQPTSTSLTWKISRRYGQFEQLHERLLKEIGSDHVPAKLPGKSLLRKMSEDYIRQRRIDLSKYLRDLLLDTRVAASEAMSHFLVESIGTVLKAHVVGLKKSVYAAYSRNGSIQNDSDDIIRTPTNQAAAPSSQQLPPSTPSSTPYVHLTRTELCERLQSAEERADRATSELASLHADWESKFNELVAHAKSLRAEKKAALKSIQDMDALVKRYKAEKKVLIREVKENRVQMAAMGVLGAAAAQAGSGNPESHSPTSAQTISPSLQSSPARGGNRDDLASIPPRDCKSPEPSDEEPIFTGISRPYSVSTVVPSTASRNPTTPNRK